jgi:hypothetical protein
LSTDEITEVKSRVERIRIDRARSQALKESAEKTYADAMAELKDKFGLDNLADAHAMLAELQDKYQQELATITAMLDEIE